MITGVHTLIYSKDAEADKAFFRDVLKFNYVDSGEGWLIFALPPSELGVHPTDGNGFHEMYLMCDDVNEFVREMKGKGVQCSEPQDAGWGVLTEITLPGGGRLGVYEPRHERP